ncbi:PEP-CTERM sorting domain-containing protein [Ruficoccus sp. ZRK36]|uniref:PEP-CTERM sorting domain-containing protein n=1 Tax=Ruficoccus sp. ZRK36 TaxID=2866311 RepID=UPI001C730997|nr:PEP-CTERM sorting domain-containing protein [Ruficoccus sp. ZRK36]QYY36776.1 PEP-CTERM sorting domain-containing protein [Ruficoccus sp. ZRK36]
MNLTSASTYAMVRDVFESLNTSGADYYLSMAFQIVSESSTGTVGSGTSYFAWGADDDVTYVHNQTLGGTNASNVIARVGDASEYRASTAANLKYGTTYFLVVEYGGWDSGVNGYTTATSWVYADDGEGGTTIVSATKTVVSETTGSKGIIGLNLRTHFITEDTHLLFDDIVFGDSLASVTGAIPEPATYAVFAGLAILGISILRRKRRS